MNIRVYPEYYEGDLLSEGIEIFGDRSHGFSRMNLQVSGKIECFYDKVGDDGSNTPSTGAFIPCVYELNDVAIGLVCCMDINNPVVYAPVIERLNKSLLKHKVLAISAYMTDKSWFSGESLQPYLCGFNVVLSNGCAYGPRSFISDENGLKLKSLELSLGNRKLINCGNT
ncbi:hypothetical protein [Sessilibacter corallicola]|uniref:CN hydrolase domain-containing protein n=1 Tax=Sessilibacter corallicola TaxID=2904075 RepID=A0ABQ0A9V4_9GAMM